MFIKTCNLNRCQIMHILKSSCMCKVHVMEDGCHFVLPVHCCVHHEEGQLRIKLCGCVNSRIMNCLKSAEICSIEFENCTSGGMLSVVASGHVHCTHCHCNIETITFHVKEVTGRMYCC